VEEGAAELAKKVRNAYGVYCTAVAIHGNVVITTHQSGDEQEHGVSII
jgi:hypothetical protein